MGIYGYYYEIKSYSGSDVISHSSADYGTHEFERFTSEMSKVVGWHRQDITNGQAIMVHVIAGVFNNEGQTQFTQIADYSHYADII